MNAIDDDRDWWDALRNVVHDCANDGDSHVEYYGDQLEDLLRLRGVLEGSTQPTRGELADAIEADVQAAVFTAKGVREAALDAIDVLVARGWVGVSDTPNETQ